jgi:hypothetical protein
MFLGAPVINFNGEFLVDSLSLGSVQVGEVKIPALQIIIQQVNPYPVLASHDKYFEILAYCMVAKRHDMQRISAYTPCVVMQSDNKQTTPLVTHVTWYIPKDLHYQAQREMIQMKQKKRPPINHFPCTEQAFAEFTSWQR